MDFFFFLRLLWFSLYSQRVCFCSGAGAATALNKVDTRWCRRLWTLSAGSWTHGGRRPPSVGIKRFPIRPASVCVCVGLVLLYGLPSTLCFAFFNRISSSKPHMAIQNSRFDSRVTEIELAPLHVCRCLSYRLIKINPKREKSKQHVLPFFVSFVVPFEFFNKLSTWKKQNSNGGVDRMLGDDPDDVAKEEEIKTCRRRNDSSRSVLGRRMSVGIYA